MTKQERAHASVVEVDPDAVGAFIGRYVRVRACSYPLPVVECLPVCVLVYVICVGVFTHWMGGIVMSS